MEWFVYAVAAMLLFGLANVALKELLKTDFLTGLQAHSTDLAKAGLALAVFLVAVYFVFLRALPWPAQTPLLLGAFLVLAGAGFVLFTLGMQSGKAALVTAVASASTVVVALVSMLIFKDALSVKEWTGIALTVVGVMMLAR